MKHKARFMCLLRHLAMKRIPPIVQLLGSHDHKQ